jgi:molybdenum cofactor guanylyltransferase
MIDATLVVLAGGVGSRLGTFKSRIVLQGQPILNRIAGLFDVASRTLVAHRDDPSPAGSTAFDRVIFDSLQDAGPIAGVLAAIEVCRGESMVVLPVDQPGVTQDHVLELFRQSADAPIAMFRRGELIEPFPLVIRPSGFAAVRSYAQSGGRSLRGLSQLDGATLIDAPSSWPASVWSNLNTPADVAAAGGVVSTG